MHYVVSDIHGCLDKFKKLLQLIDFGDDDILYVLGDCVDRGEDPMGVLSLMMQYSNIIPIIGNHEYIMIRLLPQLMKEITDDTIKIVLTEEMMNEYFYWLQDGAQTTINGFKALSKEMQDEIIDYISEFTLYEKVDVKGKRFLLIHSLPDNFEGNKLDNYKLEEIVFGRFDYNKQFSDDMIIVVGHTPTLLIDENYKGQIYQGKNLYDIDCGAVFGYSLGCLCLENMQEFYV